MTSDIIHWSLVVDEQTGFSIKRPSEQLARSVMPYTERSKAHHGWLFRLVLFKTNTRGIYPAFLSPCLNSSSFLDETVRLRIFFILDTKTVG